MSCPVCQRPKDHEPECPEAEETGFEPRLDRFVGELETTAVKFRVVSDRLSQKTTN